MYRSLIAYSHLTPEQQDAIDRDGGPFIVAHPMGLWVFEYWSEAYEFAAEFLGEVYDGIKSRAHVTHTGTYSNIPGVL